MKLKHGLAISAFIFTVVLSGCELSPGGGCDKEVAPATESLRKGTPPKGPKNPGGGTTPIGTLPPDTTVVPDPGPSSGIGCDVYVTATQVLCSYGAWGDIWLKLDNGHYLQPWNNSTATTQITPGTRYKVGYTLMAKDTRYFGLVVCAMAPSDPLALAPAIVSVSCIEPVIN